MSRRYAGRGPYVRPMQGWWKRDPFFVRYMWREATALGVLVYAVVLMVGVLRLSQGEAAWSGFVAALKSPLSVVLHLVLLLAMFIHAKSWFEIMPKTMPKMKAANGEPVAAATITRAGWSAVAVCSLVLLALAWWGGRS